MRKAIVGGSGAGIGFLVGIGFEVSPLQSWWFSIPIWAIAAVWGTAWMIAAMNEKEMAWRSPIRWPITKRQARPELSKHPSGVGGEEVKEVVQLSTGDPVLDRFNAEWRNRRTRDGARQTATQYVNTHPDMFSDFGGKDIPELVALVEEHRRTAQDAERARTRVDLWLLAMHPPQRITGQVDMAVRPPSSQDGPILSGEVIAGAGTQGGDESQPLAPRPEPPDRSHTEVAIRTYPPRAWNTPATRVDGQTVRFVTEGGETGIPLPGKLRSMRFLTPHEQIVRAADLPATVPLGDGRHLTVVAFKWGEVTDTALGYAIIDEADAVGVEVMFQAFYET